MPGHARIAACPSEGTACCDEGSIAALIMVAAVQEGRGWLEDQKLRSLLEFQSGPAGD